MPFNSIEVEVHRHSPEAPWTYAQLDRRQRELAARVRAGARGALLLSELAPVITIGRRTPASDLLVPPRDVAIVRTDRGGLATYHGPGQWVLFAVDRLEILTGDRRGVRQAVEGLLEAAAEVGRIYWGGPGEVRVGRGIETGVWCPRGKFAALGVHVEEQVLLHGIAVNGFRTETSFMGLRPCGLDAPVAFLLEAGDAAGKLSSESRSAGFEELGQRLVAAVCGRFWPEMSNNQSV